MVKEELKAVAIGDKAVPTYTEKYKGAHYYVFTRDFGELGDSDLSIYDEARATVKIPTGLNTGINSKYPRTAYISLGIGSALVNGEAVDIGIRSTGDGWTPVVGDHRLDKYEDFDLRYKVVGANTAKIVAAPIDPTHVRIKVEFFNVSGTRIGLPCNEIVPVEYTIWARYHRFASLLNNDENSSTDGTFMTGGAFMDLSIHHKGTGVYEWLEDWGIPTQAVEYAWIVGPGQCKVTERTDRGEKFSIINR